MPKRFFITGTAGFIGFHLARALLEAGHTVTGFDGMTPYYDVALKQAREAILLRHSNYISVHGMLEDFATLERAAAAASPEVVVHLAAQAGVRYSVENPRAYIDSNGVGSFNVLEIARQLKPEHLMLASTSSVYGANDKLPFAETDPADRPLSLYAATKKAMEVMSHSYAHLWGLPTTCFRFFTVYGPWGRPDMALFKFVAAILAGRPIEIYGNGEMRRDFTYVDDLMAAIIALVECPPRLGEPVGPAGMDTLSRVAPWRVVNIAGGRPTELMDFVAAVESALGKRAQRNFLPMQMGDVRETHASPDLLRALVGDVPSTPVSDGVGAFVDWYRAYHAA